MTTPPPPNLGENQQTTFIQELDFYIQQMQANGAPQLAAAFKSYALGVHALHPTYTVQQVLNAFVATDLAKSLGAGLGGAGTALGQLPAQAGAAATNTMKSLSNPLDFLGSFNLGSWFLRIGEILLGLVLIGVGVARLTGTQNMISKVAKVALK